MLNNLKFFREIFKNVYANFVSAKIKIVLIQNLPCKSYQAEIFQRSMAYPKIISKYWEIEIFSL